MKIQLTSGSERDAFVAVDPESSDYSVVFAKPERAKAATFTVVDAGQGYIALAVDDGEAGTYWAPREDISTFSEFIRVDVAPPPSAA
mmetsp:Transcript_27911/g.86516  ORF Transcript_27911/g.86516 Transcript_27911/m.86516 type:complete len:87 (-) Transcript_27911:158-418(-)